MSDSRGRKTLSVVTPVYHSSRSLPALCDRLAALEGELSQRHLALEIVFVDDGSPDNSLEELMAFKEKRPATKIIKLTRNFGAVAASKTGLRFVTGECFVLLAADLQEPVEKIAEMADCWLAGSKFVVCARASRKEPVVSTFFSSIYYRAVKYLVLNDYPPRGFGLMLMDKAMLPYMESSSKNISPQIYAFWLGFTPTVLAHDRPEQPYGRSSWTLSKKLRLFIDTFTLLSAAPIRIISIFGILIAGLSFAYGLYILVNAILGNFDVPGFATIVVLISFFSGLILVMLGIIGEYVWRVVDATGGSAETVIEETYL